MISYANLFMDRFERAFLAQEPIQPLVWKRYIDEILCIWTGSRSELDNFPDRLNRAHHSIKFTWSISNERIQFLDLNIFKGDRFTETGLLDLNTHFKSTNTFQYLHFSSSHPRSVFKGLVKGEAIRFLRSNTHAPTYHAMLRKFRQHLFHLSFLPLPSSASARTPLLRLPWSRHPSLDPAALLHARYPPYPLLE